MSCSFSRAAFQYGIKMSEGRKTRRFKETNDKAELDRQWKKISAVSAQLGWGCCARSSHPALASVCESTRAGSLPAGFAPYESISQVLGASVLQRCLELCLEPLSWEQPQPGALCSGLCSR